MRIIRNTTGFTRDEVVAVAKFVAPPGVAGYGIHLTNSERGSRGWAYMSENKIVVRLCLKTLYPSKPSGPCRVKRGYLPMPYFADRREVLVFIMAHELRHLWQYRVPRGRRVWGARGQFSERDCDAYAIRMLRQWRREN